MILLSLIIITSILGNKFKEGTSQIINGFNLDPRDFNYHVSIIGNYDYICGGGILDENHVITAAHCVENFEAHDLFIIAGVKYLCDRDGISRNIRKKYVSVDYYGERKSLYDFAVLRLQIPLVLGNKIGVITLPTEHVWPDNVTTCSIPGLEKRAEVSDRYKGKLSWVQLMLIPNEICECMIGVQVYPSTLCATTIEENDLTYGDSGGILVCNGVAVGLLKGGKNYAYLFTRIFNFVDYIKSVLRAK